MHHGTTQYSLSKTVTEQEANTIEQNKIQLTQRKFTQHNTTLRKSAII